MGTEEQGQFVLHTLYILRYPTYQIPGRYCRFTVFGKSLVQYLRRAPRDSTGETTCFRGWWPHSHGLNWKERNYYPDLDSWSTASTINAELTEFGQIVCDVLKAEFLDWSPDYEPPEDLSNF